MGLINGFVTWTNENFGSFGSPGLFTLAFMESSFFPVPPDLLLISFTLANPELAFFFALICTLGSVFGGMFGYGIGYVGEQLVLEKFFSKRKIERVHKLFEKYETWAILIAGFTPIPYKVFTISAGVFYVNFKKFVVASFIGRGARFFLVALLTKLYGQTVIDFLDKFDIILLEVVGIALVAYITYRIFKKK